MGEILSFKEHVAKLEDEINKNDNEQQDESEKELGNKIEKIKKLIENKRFALAPNEKTKEMKGKAWFKKPLMGRMEGMYFIEEDGTVFELDFKKDDFLGTLPGMENIFLDKIQTIMEKVGLNLCVINSDLQRAANIEEEIEKNKKIAN